MVCYVDQDGHTYDFGFGMNWKGVIQDARTAKYVNQVAKPSISVRGNMVTLTSEIPGVKIYFTLDGKTPSFITGNLYTKSFPIKKGSIVKAIAKIYGVNNSGLLTYVYN
jgi:beta-glucosidase